MAGKRLGPRLFVDDARLPNLTPTTSFATCSRSTSELDSNSPEEPKVTSYVTLGILVKVRGMRRNCSSRKLALPKEVGRLSKQNAGAYEYT